MSGYVPNTPPAEREAELKQVTPVDRHAQHWAQYEQHGKPPPAPPDKIRIALRIGVFFDGTGNNASNSTAGRLCGAHHPVRPEDLAASCKPYMGDPDSSYGNDITNIRKLSALYLDTPTAQGDGQQKQVFRRLYVDGIGTRTGEKDNLLGAGTGRGSSGVEGRVQQAFARIKGLFNDLLAENPDSEVTSLTFDTFGFSRGAAAARHFANEVVRGKRGPLGSLLREGADAFSPTFNDQYQRDITMGFIGLFDTVASVAGLANLGNVRSAIAPGVNLHLAPQHFDHVVHLVARDEARANFALSTVQPDHTEITLPGAHSNIGGGYRADMEERVLLSPMQALTVQRGADVKTTSIYRDALQAKARLESEGWPATVLEVVTPPPTLLPADRQDRLAPRQQRVYAGLQLRRRVRGELSRVYLRVMYELAKQRGVQFEDIPNTPEHAIPAELQPLCDRFIAGDYSTTLAEEALLKSRYIHRSAHWNNPLGKATHNGFKMVYINAPTADGVRIHHPHVPDWTLL
ncbi:MAG: T6SS phospholipase effector Tle1-like catalytic domain-containing protein [Pseudomonas sp.]|uniref:T6SS phospholipase effector Tle1-like catalytic domain-containing protein n=1 Tax=Pseudomonas sp. TaxID=306 RepID=UPI003D09BF79